MAVRRTRDMVNRLDTSNPFFEGVAAGQNIGERLGTQLHTGARERFAITQQKRKQVVEDELNKERLRSMKAGSTLAESQAEMYKPLAQSRLDASAMATRNAELQMALSTEAGKRADAHLRETMTQNEYNRYISSPEYYNTMMSAQQEHSATVAQAQRVTDDNARAQFASLSSQYVVDSGNKDANGQPIFVQRKMTSKEQKGVEDMVRYLFPTASWLPDVIPVPTRGGKPAPEVKVPTGRTPERTFRPGVDVPAGEATTSWGEKTLPRAGYDVGKEFLRRGYGTPVTDWLGGLSNLWNKPSGELTAGDYFSAVQPPLPFIPRIGQLQQAPEEMPPELLEFIRSRGRRGEMSADMLEFIKQQEGR